jgi:hypothetical protein
MRLGQLSRKIGVSTAEIINFLASKEIAIGEDSNTKIEDDHTAWVIQKYAPELQETPMAITAEEKPQSIELVEMPAPKQVVETAIVNFTASEEPTTEIESLPEIIKASKIELSGLKVLGKIEIPERKKKETSLEEIALEKPTEEIERKIRTDRRPSQREYEERPRKNPIALQREREEREAEKRRKEQLLLAKEKKAQHYQSKVKAQVATKRIKMIEEPLEKIDAPMEEIPTTWWAKFKKWLRT